jgi:hypothetical protein
VYVDANLMPSGKGKEWMHKIPIEKNSLAQAGADKDQWQAGLALENVCLRKCAQVRSYDIYIYCLVVSSMNFIFHFIYIYGMSSQPH